jgi:hypothetical protein
MNDACFTTQDLMNKICNNLVVLRFFFHLFYVAADSHETPQGLPETKTDTIMLHKKLKEPHWSVVGRWGARNLHGWHVAFPPRLPPETAAYTVEVLQFKNTSDVAV